MEVRNRIKKNAPRTLKGSQIRPNPKNWRDHPEEQKTAIRTAFGRIGITAPVIVREVSKDEYMLMDGHLRAELLGDQEIPVVVLNDDVTDEEFQEMLMTHDAISSLATINDENWHQLANDNQALFEEYGSVLKDISALSGMFIEDKDNDSNSSSSGEVDIDAVSLDKRCPRCGFEFD